MQTFGIPFLKKGGIHIKKKNRGLFTKYCNGKVTEECIQRGKNSPDPKIRKRATFAQASRKWSKKHQSGGEFIMLDTYYSKDNDKGDSKLFINNSPKKQSIIKGNDFVKHILESISGKKFLSNTPQAIETFALDSLQGIPEHKGDSSFVIQENKYVYTPGAEKFYKKQGMSSTYIPINKDQYNKLKSLLK